MAEKFIQNADKVAGIIAFLLFFVTVFNAFTVSIGMVNICLEIKRLIPATL